MYVYLVMKKNSDKVVYSTTNKDAAKEYIKHHTYFSDYKGTRFELKTVSVANEKPIEAPKEKYLDIRYSISAYAFPIPVAEDEKIKFYKDIKIGIGETKPCANDLTLEILNTCRIDMDFRGITDNKAKYDGKYYKLLHYNSIGNLFVENGYPDESRKDLEARAERIISRYYEKILDHMFRFMIEDYLARKASGEKI